jgi:hypothetical protein
MSVAALLGLWSVRGKYALKAADLIEYQHAYCQIDGPLLQGTIDPVLLGTDGSGATIVLDGLHRIVRAHQLGISRLPVSYDEASQVHLDNWNSVLGIEGDQ